MKVGETVYTVNNKTNEVDSWSYAGMLRTPDEILCHLTKGRTYCYLPARCVFITEEEARKVAEKK